MKNFGNFHADIEQELKTRGFHVLDQTRALIPGNYPNPFPQYPELPDIELGSSYVIRLFVRLILQGTERIDSGLIDVRIGEKCDNLYTGRIETTLPADFPLHEGDQLTLKFEQILYRQTLRN